MPGQPYDDNGHELVVDEAKGFNNFFERGSPQAGFGESIRKLNDPFGSTASVHSFLTRGFLLEEITPAVAELWQRGLEEMSHPEMQDVYGGVVLKDTWANVDATKLSWWTQQALLIIALSNSVNGRANRMNTADFTGYNPDLVTGGPLWHGKGRRRDRNNNGHTPDAAFPGLETGAAR